MPLEDNANSENEKPRSIRELLDNPPDNREDGVTYLGDEFIPCGDRLLRAAHNEPYSESRASKLAPYVIAGIIGLGVIGASIYITKTIYQHYHPNNIPNQEVLEDKK